MISEVRSSTFDSDQIFGPDEEADTETRTETSNRVSAPPYLDPPTEAVELVRTFVTDLDASYRVATLSSRKDRVLRFAFPIGDFLVGLFSGGYTRRALGFHGPRPGRHPVPGTVSPHQLKKRWKVRHGDYLPPAPAKANRRQRAAFHYATTTLTGAPPDYPALD